MGIHLTVVSFSHQNIWAKVRVVTCQVFCAILVALHSKILIWNFSSGCDQMQISNNGIWSHHDRNFWIKTFKHSAIIISELMDPTTAVPVDISSSLDPSSPHFCTVSSCRKIKNLPHIPASEKFSLLLTLTSNMSFQLQKLSTTVKFWRNFTSSIKS